MNKRLVKVSFCLQRVNELEVITADILWTGSKDVANLTSSETSVNRLVVFVVS